MMETNPDLFLPELFNPEPFFDLSSSQIGAFEPIDVIMPVQAANAILERNLTSIFRELPVNRLLVGDGGADDETLEVFNRFPRVTIVNHRHLNTLGGSLRGLIDLVETPFFSYLHSDVYLPRGFYEKVRKIELRNTWLESNRNSIVIHEQNTDEYFKSPRPYSGAQFGDSALLKEAVKTVQDDFLYRNEDLVIAELVREAGGNFVKVEAARHLHQSTTKNTKFEPAIAVQVFRSRDAAWERKTLELQYRGIIKYTSPIREGKPSYLIEHVNISLQSLMELESLNWQEIRAWVKAENAAWLPFLRKPTRARSLLSLSRRLVRRGLIELTGQLKAALTRPKGSI